MKNHAQLFATIAILAGTAAAFAHDSGATHEGVRISPHDFSAQPPREMIEILRSGNGIPAADSDTVRALAARYLSRRSNRTGGVSRTSV